jgi:hypothetical protein
MRRNEVEQVGRTNSDMLELFDREEELNGKK